MSACQTAWADVHELATPPPMPCTPPMVRIRVGFSHSCLDRGRRPIVILRPGRVEVSEAAFALKDGVGEIYFCTCAAFAYGRCSWRPGRSSAAPTKTGNLCCRLPGVKSFAFRTLCRWHSGRRCAQALAFSPIDLSVSQTFPDGSPRIALVLIFSVELRSNCLPNKMASRD